jgi:hypothetical protein
MNIPDPTRDGRPMAKHLAGAFRKGWQSASEGKPRSRCPYNPRDTAVVGRGRHMPTGARAYARAWFEGWDLFHQSNPKP